MVLSAIDLRDESVTESYFKLIMHQKSRVIRQYDPAFVLFLNSKFIFVN